MLLSICIPTYNRGLFLERALSSIINEIEVYKLNKYVEICISDNASTDATFEIVNNFKKKDIVSIVFKQLPENIGAPRNFLSAVDISNGSFVWLMGSDDLIIEGKLKFIIEILLSKENISIFLGDRTNLNSNQKVISTEYWAKKANLVKKDTMSDYIKNCNSIGGLFSYISDIIFLKSQWLNIIDTKQINKLFDSPYIHVYILLYMIKEGAVLNYIHEPIVYNQSDNDSFLQGKYFNRLKIDFEYLEIFTLIFGFNSSEYNECKKLLNKERTVFHFLKAKLNISSKTEQLDFDAFIKKYQQKHYLIKYTPNFIIELLLKIYKLFNYKRFV